MPAVNPDDALRAAKAVADLYGEAVARLLGLVASRLASGIEVADEAWALLKLSELSKLRAEAEREVEQLTKSVMAETTKQIHEGAARGAAAAAAEVPRVPTSATGVTLPTLAPMTNRAAVKALVDETLTGLRGANAGILRSVDDMYRKVIAEVSAPGVVLGTETRLAATQRALDRFAAEGITGFVDSRGGQWDIESYAETATRTAAQRATIAGRMAEYTDRGVQYVIVSDSPGECPLCRPFERKALSVNGQGVGTTLPGGILVVDTVEGARSKGFQHPNCRHDLRPYVEGLTKAPEAATADPSGNTIREEQRSLERTKRTAKREQAVAITPEAKAKATAKVKASNARLSALTDDRKAYAESRAEAARQRNNAAGVRKWERVAADVEGPGKRQPQREQVKRAR